MREFVRKFFTLFLAVVLISPQLAWSVGPIEIDAGVPNDGALGIDAVAPSAILPLSNADLDSSISMGDLQSAGNIESLETKGALPAESLPIASTLQSAQALAGEQEPTVVLGVLSVAVVSAKIPAVTSKKGKQPSCAATIKTLGQIINTGSSDNIAKALETTYTGALSESANANGISEGEESTGDEQDLSEESRKIHREYEQSSKLRYEKFKEKVSLFKAGVFSTVFIQEQGVVVIAVTVNGLIMARPVIEEKLASGEIPAVEKANWGRTLAAVEKFGQEMNAVIEVDQSEHAQAHQRMAAIDREIAARRAKARLAIGKGLESWGVPNKISVDPGEPQGLRYSNLYRMNGMPTDLGVSLHKILSPLVAQDPSALSRITKNQLHDAARLLAEGLKYVLDPSSEDFQKLKRMGLISEGYAYPEWKESFEKKAKEALLAEPESGDSSFGLGVRPESKRSTEVLKGIYRDAVHQYQTVSMGASRLSLEESKKEIARLDNLIRALAGAMGLTIDLGNGPITLGVQHKQLLPILTELKKRQADEEVIKTVIRSFPLGESLYRLGVHKLWAKGLTGQGRKIAFIDNSVDFAHPDFSGVQSLSENPTRDRGWLTKGPHGTPMADIAHVIAPDAEIQSYQALSNSKGLPGVHLSGEETKIALLKAMDRAKANGAQIINLSLGEAMGLSNDAMAKKIAEFAKEGILVIVSAGNNGFDIPGNFQLGTPGTAPDAITVGAVDYHGKRGYFAARGLAMNPEDYSLKDKPEIYTFGVNIKAAMRLPKEIYKQEPVPYTDVSGTSPAAPHVSGLAALMLQAAMESGLKTSGAQTIPAAKQALLAAAKLVNRLPVLDNGPKAVAEFVRILSSQDSGVSSRVGFAPRGTRAKRPRVPKN